MAKKRTKSQTHTRWRYIEAGDKHKIEWGLVVINYTIAYPAANPLVFNVTVSGCDGAQVTAWLTDVDGDQTFATVTSPPPPAPPPPPSWTVTFPTMPAGDYTVTVQAQCSNGDIANNSQDVTLSDPS